MGGGRTSASAEAIALVAAEAIALVAAEARLLRIGRKIALLHQMADAICLGAWRAKPDRLLDGSDFLRVVDKRGRKVQQDKSAPQVRKPGPDFPAIQQ